MTPRGAERYDHLVQMCRGVEVLTPEDPYPVFAGDGSPVRVAPLFTLYDYSWLMPGTTTAEASLAAAQAVGWVARDESLLHPDPCPSRPNGAAPPHRGLAPPLPDSG